MTDLFLCTTLRRGGYAYDVVIYFTCHNYHPGCPARIYGDPGDCYPAEPDEAEFEFVRAEFDGTPPEETDWGGGISIAPGEFTKAEIATLRDWFDAHEAEALQAYVDQHADAWLDRADYEYERRRDGQMERVR